MKLGSIELQPLSDGWFGLDGGAMFGVVPRVLWEKRNPPDERNRIRLALRPLLIVTGPETILVDTGIGRKYGDRFNDMFNVDQSSDDLLTSLARTGRRPEDVTQVVLTHLHFDHAGGATRLDENGRPVPTFSNARHFVQQTEWEDANNPNRRTRGSYRPDDFLPLDAAGLIKKVDGNTDIAPGIRLLRTGGHTRGHQVVLVRSEDHTAIYWADLIPTASHVPIPYIMGYDTYPLETIRGKEELLARAADGEWISIFEHDPDLDVALIVRDGDGFRARSIERPLPTKE
ncbi:MAG TPA: MBL fold metallo-hydrolase [candidate division WOR-3 bacterium]|uniref:MBL fold metallo-hydrolase n=1 Tax=candidate division WOR-3 bacterium TaxID=2052148 RepID=A0A7V0T5Y3_UNCW3|nr:MBL fold metallo-hydrolase [candidate division WOR-3 bacterium]